MLKDYIRPLRKRIIVNAVVKMTGTLLEIMLPAILAHIVNELVPAGNKRVILLWGLMMILMSFAAWVGNFTANRMAARSAATVVYRIRKDLFARCMSLSARQIDRYSVSSLESRLTSDTYNLHRVLGATLRMGLRSTMLFIGGVSVCLWLCWQLALVLLLLLPPLLLIVRWVLKKGIPLFHEVRRKIDDMVQVIRENIRGIKVSKALDKTIYEQERFGEHNEAVKDAEMDAQNRMALMGPLVNSVLFAILAIVLIVGAFLVNEGLTKPGTVMAFLSYNLQIAFSLLTLNRMFNMYTLASSSWDRIKEVLQTPEDMNQKEHPCGTLPLPPPSPEVPEVEFRRVRFSYLNKKDNLKDISFKLYPGETLGIMGATGSGKSTIIRLLLRQYEADEGEILLRGVNIKRLERSDLHRLFGTVFQNDFLFAGTVRKNIDFGRGFTDEELIKATEDAQAAEFLAAKEGGLDFRLASKGVNLSGGQKQRLLLSRALAGSPDILILDDASSALDFNTEARLRKALADEYAAQSTIIIAQRISSVRRAEHILYLDKGHMLAYGSHEQLLKTCPPYAEIARMQMGNEEELAAGRDLSLRAENAGQTAAAEGGRA